jgi:hypothetical protein
MKSPVAIIYDEEGHPIQSDSDGPTRIMASDSDVACLLKQVLEELRLIRTHMELLTDNTIKPTDVEG